MKRRRLLVGAVAVMAIGLSIGLVLVQRAPVSDHACGATLVSLPSFREVKDLTTRLVLFDDGPEPSRWQAVESSFPITTGSVEVIGIQEYRDHWPPEADLLVQVHLRKWSSDRWYLMTLNNAAGSWQITHATHSVDFERYDNEPGVDELAGFMLHSTWQPHQLCPRSRRVELGAYIDKIPPCTPPRPKCEFTGEGERAFHQRGCKTCHSVDGSNRVGGTMKGLFGSTVVLADGSKVTADREYLRESILEPNAKIVKGYDPAMPSYWGQLNDHQLDHLIDYIQSLKD